MPEQAVSTRCEILELRARAEEALGEQFDIEFRVVLGGGTLPMMR
jgi:uncharacterized protein (DUF885 family)